MSQNPPNTPKQLPEEIKNFFSAGTTFSFIGCASTVQVVWAVLGRFSPILRLELVGLVISFLIVLAYALVIPEPEGYPNAGKRRITLAEFIFGTINSFVIFAVVLGLNAVT